MLTQDALGTRDMSRTADVRTIHDGEHGGPRGHSERVSNSPPRSRLKDTEHCFRRCAYPNNTFVQPFPDKMPWLVDPSIFFECTNTTTALEVISVDATAEWASIAIINMGALWDFRCGS